MEKKTEKKLGYFFIVLGVVSAIVTFLEGMIYYNAETYSVFWVRCLLIVQNTIKSFVFRSDINLRDMSKALVNIPRFSYEWFVGYAYTVAVFTAPYCTLAMVYKVLEKIFRFKSLFWRMSRKDKVIVIFGYNEEVKELLETKDSLKNKKEARYRIHLVAEKISRETEVELLKQRIRCHNVDFLKLSKKSNQLEFFMKKIEADKVVQIVLFEESAAKNFSLYKMFHDNEKIKNCLNENVRFVCRCEDVGTRRIIEDYHDSNITSKDLEIIGIHELRAREVLAKHSLHEYWRGSGMPAKEWKLHLLIVGFGKLGQQILLQSMNLGVADQNNEILIDVVDFDVDKKKSIFANYFSDEYVQMDGDVFTIPQKLADGKFTIRFHKMDIRYKEFGKLLQKTGEPEKDGIYTYVAICVEDMDVSLHCMSEIEHYLHKNTDKEEKKKTSIGIRMESNRQMADYISENSKTYQNVFVIEDAGSVVSLDELLHDEITSEAKEFNYIYNMMDLKVAENYLDQNKEKTKNEKDDMKQLSEKKRKKLERIKAEQEAAERKQLILKKWKDMPMFKRNSNLAIAQHETTRNELVGRYPGVKEKTEKEKALDAKLQVWFDENGMLLQDRGNVWLYKNEGALLDVLEQDEQFATALRYAKTEHRRWCYFMASCGWKCLDSRYWEKDAADKANACMCPWDELATRVKPQKDKEPKYYSCKYDLMPLLMRYKGNQGGKKDE